MSLFIKICGITEPDSAIIAAQSGADAIGLVFAASPRRVSPQEARRIAAAVPDQIIRVAVFLRPDQEEIDRVLSVFVPDLVQADAGSRLELPPSVGLLPVVRGVGDIDEVQVGVGMVLFEGAMSGAGVSADWGEAARLARRSRLVLAGGLHPDNVAGAIASVRPFGVDVSSGVEVFPGVKDPSRIRQFVEAARTAERVSQG